MAGFPTAAAHLQLGRAVTGIARGPLACRARRPGEKFCLNKTDSWPLPQSRPLPLGCVPFTVAQVRRRSYCTSVQTIFPEVDQTVEPSPLPSMVGAPFARLLANLVVMGTGVLGRAFVEAYKQALQSARRQSAP